VKARSDDALLVFDFGGGTLDVSVVKVDLGASGDRKAKVIGKAGCELGGMDIDQWLAKDLLERNGIPERQVKELLARVLLEVEGVKERLSFATDGKTEEPVSLVDPSRGLVLTGGYSRRDLEDLLEANGLPQQVNNTITDALTAAAEKYGVRSADIKTVLMTGGTSLIPYVQKLVRNFFGARVRCERPFDAVATGACYYASGAEDLIDHIQHNYALKYFDAKRNVHDYKTLIPAGVPYPTEEEFIAFHLKGLYDGMEDFGLFICEVGKSGSGKCTLRTTAGGEFEYQADDSGTNGVFCINEDKPTFIKANPPSKKDEKRFKVSFNVDSQRRLRVTVFDLLTRHFICRDMPVVKLV